MIKVIGAGLAGSEAAYYLASRGAEAEKAFARAQPCGVCRIGMLQFIEEQRRIRQCLRTSERGDAKNRISYDGGGGENARSRGRRIGG